MPTRSLSPITPAAISALYRAALADGDIDTADACYRAMAGEKDAFAEVERILRGQVSK